MASTFKSKPQAAVARKIIKGRLKRPIAKVGAKGRRSLREIKADPMAPAEDLHLLRVKDPLAALLHPNCPVELWWTLAENHPMEAMESPLYSMLTLENPGRWDVMESQKFNSWIIEIASRLSEKARRSFATDCAEHVLPIFEKLYPRDKRPKTAIKISRHLAEGDIAKPQRELDEAEDASRQATYSAAKAKSDNNIAASYAAQAAGDAVRISVASAATASLMARLARLHNDESIEAEKRWQWNRLREYVEQAAGRSRRSPVSGRVGAAEEQPKWSNPATPPEELAKLAKAEPRAYTNPNMPFAELNRGAGQYPWYVEANPVLPMLRLEDPAVFKKLHDTLRHGWREQAGLPLLSEKSRRLYLADCAEQVIPIYEKTHPNDQRLRKAIQVARQFAQHEASPRKLRATNAIVSKIASELNPPTGKYNPTPAYYAACAVVSATASQMTVKSTINGTTLALWATQDVKGFDQVLDWQLGRILHYIFLEHPELRPPQQVGRKAAVGAKPKWSDPSVKPEELAKQAIRVPRTYTNPNLPLEALIKGANTHPWYVEQNPALSMFMLEDPSVALRLKEAINSGWRGYGASSLKKPNQRLYGMDIARRALAILEEVYPNDQLARNCIRRALDVINEESFGDSTDADLKKIANQISDAAHHQYSKNAAAQAAAFAISYGIIGEYGDSGHYLPSAKAYLEASRSGSSKEGKAAQSAEFKWQENRIRYYFQKEHPEIKLPESVGAKPKWNDPAAKPEDLIRQAPKVPKTYSNPNIPLEALIKGAFKHPLQVEQNPVLSMLQLEDPVKVESLKVALASGWLAVLYPTLDDVSKRLFAADCAAHVLHFFEDKFPDDKRPRQAIEAARIFAASPETVRSKKAMISAAAAAWTSFTIANQGPPSGENAPMNAVRAAIDSAQSELSATQAAAYHGARAAREAVIFSGNSATFQATAAAAFTAEKVWQGNRVRFYYAQEHPEYLPPQIAGKVRPTRKKS